MHQRKIIHVDMDAFYASIEQRDFPELRGKPVIVGGKPNSRGVVCTASYEARVFGVHSAMPCAHAYRLCPQGIFVPPRFEAYKEASVIIRGIFESVTDKVEPLSLDEAYLDVTENTLGEPSATRVAEYIIKRIKEETGLTASAGVATNKFLAKLASDMDKPAGLTVIPPKRVPEVLRALPVRRIHGIGKATEARLSNLGIHTTADLRAFGEADLIRKVGRMGSWYYQLAQGIDNREVNGHRSRKSLGAERTFSEDLREPEDLEARLKDIATEVARRLEKSKFRGRTLTLKVTYKGFERISRSITFDPEAPRHPDALLRAGLNLLGGTQAQGRPIRLLGLSISNPLEAGQPQQLTLPFKKAS